jgi:hypothetical protein
MWVFKRELLWRAVFALTFGIFGVMGLIFKWNSGVTGSMLGVSLGGFIALVINLCNKKLRKQKEEAYEEEHSEPNVTFRWKASYYTLVVVMFVETVGLYLFMILKNDTAVAVLAVLLLVQMLLSEALYAFYKWNRW